MAPFFSFFRLGGGGVSGVVTKYPETLSSHFSRKTDSFLSALAVVGDAVITVFRTLTLTNTPKVNILFVTRYQ